MNLIERGWTRSREKCRQNGKVVKEVDDKKAKRKAQLQNLFTTFAISGLVRCDKIINSTVKSFFCWGSASTASDIKKLRPGMGGKCRRICSDIVG